MRFTGTTVVSLDNGLIAEEIGLATLSPCSGSSD